MGCSQEEKKHKPRKNAQETNNDTIQSQNNHISKEEKPYVKDEKDKKETEPSKESLEKKEEIEIGQKIVNEPFQGDDNLRGVNLNRISEKQENESKESDNEKKEERQKTNENNIKKETEELNQNINNILVKETSPINQNETPKIIIKEFQNTRTLYGHSEKVTALTQLNSGKIATGGYDNTIRIWNIYDIARNDEDKIIKENGRIFVYWNSKKINYYVERVKIS